MTTTIVALADTHCHTWNQIHPKIRTAIANADITIHCGDLVRMDVVHGIQNNAKQAIIVHGNSDPPEIRKTLPYTQTIQIEQVTIGITHPAWAGPEFPPEDLLPDFTTPLQAIIFGHTHIPLNQLRNGILFINPGQAYPSFMTPATIATITIHNHNITAQIQTIVPAH